MNKKHKTKDKTAELKRQIKSLQDQVTSQADLIQAVTVQISELVRETKEKELEKTNLDVLTSEGIDVDKLHKVVLNLEKEVRTISEQHASCCGLRKTVDELGALCASALVAAGTRLGHEIADRQEDTLHSKPDQARVSSTQSATDNGKPKKTTPMKTKRLHYVSKQQENRNDQQHSATDAGSKTQTEQHRQEDEQDNEGFTVVNNKHRKKALRKKNPATSGAVMVGGANVRRIAFAARNEFNLESTIFKCKPEMLLEDAHREVRAAIQKSEAAEVDVVLHVGTDDLAQNRSVDYVLEGLANIIETARDIRSVREVSVCSVEERHDAGRNVYENSRLTNEQLKDLCQSYGARFLDLRARLHQSRFHGINRTGLLYTAEGSHNVSQLILREVYGFLD